MNALIDKPKSTRHADGVITVILEGGNSRLEKASRAQLHQIELSPFGSHWPASDEDLSLEGIRDRIHTV